jgi:hypothetical protein
VDQYGRWVIDSSRFPSSGSLNGIQVVASYVHSLGEKFGIYVTPGISDQAVAENTPITVGKIADGVHENNYNCGGRRGLTMTSDGLRLPQDLRRSLLDPPRQRRIRRLPWQQGIDVHAQGCEFA